MHAIEDLISMLHSILAQILIFPHILLDIISHVDRVKSLKWSLVAVFRSSTVVRRNREIPHKYIFPRNHFCCWKDLNNSICMTFVSLIWYTRIKQTMNMGHSFMHRNLWLLCKQPKWWRWEMSVIVIGRGKKGTPPALILLSTTNPLRTFSIKPMLALWEACKYSLDGILWNRQRSRILT